MEIPKLGLGTWEISDDRVSQVVVGAVKLVNRHIDTAQAYANERGVGEGIKNSGIIRADLFITTKLRAEIKSYNEAVTAIDGSLPSPFFYDAHMQQTQYAKTVKSAF